MAKKVQGGKVGFWNKSRNNPVPAPKLVPQKEAKKKVPAKKPAPAKKRIARVQLEEVSTPNAHPQSLAKKPVQAAPKVVIKAPVIRIPQNMGDHGEMYIRMLNNSMRVRGIFVDHVQGKLCDGYRFIEGEPVVPRVHGDPDKCDLQDTEGWYPQIRETRKPNTDMDATLVWAEQFEQDVLNFKSDRPDLLWGYQSTLNQLRFQIQMGAGAMKA